MQLNYFPVHFYFERYQINTEPYTQERLAELRNLYNSTHSFFKNGDTIYISNKDGDDSFVLGKLAERNTFSDKDVTASLIKHIFFRTFKDRFRQYTPVDFYPFRFFSGKDDIIKNALPDKLKDKISYKKLIEVQLRLTEINGVKRFGFLINIRRNWIFNISCSELHAEGFGLIGLDVLHAETLPGLTNILAPNEEFVGILKEISGTKAKVETNEGLKEFQLKELFIRKTKFNIGNYLTFATSQQKSDEILKIIESKREDVYNPKNLYAEITKIAEHLFTENGQPVLFQNKDSFCFTVESKPLAASNTIQVKIPTFIFDPAATKKHTSADRGLTNFGPYDSSTFDTKTPRALCICHKNNRGYFTNFLSHLKDGIPDSLWFQKGLVRKYDLQDLIVDVREIDDYVLDEYVKIISNYDQFKPDLAIIEITASHRNLPDTVNPYYRLKAKLLASEIPVQFVSAEKVRNFNENILNFIGLQIYAKLGGVPWVLPSQPSVDREIIIGIGHSWLRTNQYAGSAQNRVVGITTFFSGDGQYLLSDKVKDVAYENYFSELLKSLKYSIDKISDVHGWTEGETVRLIFHIFKPIKNTEFEVISQLVKEINKYKNKFAFVTISDSHPNILFDANQLGVKKNGSNEAIGVFIPDRGSNIILDDETCIVQMFGANELKTSKHGMSKPIQIRIRVPQGNYDNKGLDALIYHDLRYITQQIFSFTYLTWRSFIPGAEPATMKYSNLISRLLGKMRNVPGWDADKLNYGLKRKKWFL
jgi:hypothetical protein